MKLTIYNSAILVCLGLWSCASKSPERTSDVPADSVVAQVKSVFNADSAYNLVKAQVDMGPRNPGSQGHLKCEKFIKERLSSYGASDVSEQRTSATTYDGKSYECVNILGRFNGEQKKRILLLAHYDTRGMADNEATEENRNMPIPGANDGGSGVGVLLEIARHIGKNQPQIGVDMLFVDLEDSGMQSSWGNSDDTWCLGTQQWVKDMPYDEGELPVYGVLLDMVGGRDARFHREYISHSNAPQVVDKVWRMAAASGYGSKFINEVAGSVVDDHLYINEAGIPCVDVIETNNIHTHTFPATWHTLSDDMGSIDRGSLKAVGQTILNLIYSEEL